MNYFRTCPTTSLGESDRSSLLGADLDTWLIMVLLQYMEDLCYESSTGVEKRLHIVSFLKFRYYELNAQLYGSSGKAVYTAALTCFCKSHVLATQNNNPSMSQSKCTRAIF